MANYYNSFPEYSESNLVKQLSTAPVQLNLVCSDLAETMVNLKENEGINFHTFIIIALINFHAHSKLGIIIVILSQMLQIHV